MASIVIPRVCTFVYLILRRYVLTCVISTTWIMIEIEMSQPHHLYDCSTRIMHAQNISASSSSRRNDSMNAPGKPTTSRPALSQPVAFSLVIAPQQGRNLQFDY